MKMFFLIFAIFTFATSQSFASDLNSKSNESLVINFQDLDIERSVNLDSLTGEQSKFLLKSILKNSESIQLDDGSLIQINNIRKDKYPSNSSESHEMLIKAFRVIGGSGTGGGG